MTQMFDLYLRHQNASEVARILKKEGLQIKPSKVWKALRNPIYANRIRVPEKPPDLWPEAGVEPLISLKTWLEAQRVLEARPPMLAMKEGREKRVKQTMDKGYDVLCQLRRAYTAEITKKAGLRSRPLVRLYLTKLKENENKPIDRESGRHGKWYIKKTETGLKAQ